jgi:tryptophan 7-halogenase
MPDNPRNSDAGPIRNIAIVGGGTAGWMAASMLARALPGTRTSITVVESPDIGIIGVGEATIPPIIDLLRFLSIDEADFVRHTEATYKLGIKFVDWKTVGGSYWHPFGTFGAPIIRRPFYHAWHKARAAGLPLIFNDYSPCAALGDDFKFRFPDPATPDSPAAGLRYALHFDAVLVAKYLRTYAERLGVARLERTVAGASRRDDGLLDELKFSDGSALKADLYIDCSGFRGVLIEQVLGAGYVDWSSMLPCDRAVAAPSANTGKRAPYTQSFARGAGWQWRIPLQHRTGNGYVYSSQFCSDEEACADLLGVIGAPLADPRFLRFTTGRRKVFWSGNCVALGLASGFLEPLESTSIHLVSSGIYHLLEHYPDTHFDQSNIDSYNAEVTEEFERIRDFIVLHYCLTQREDAPLWRYCRSMALPDTLRQRIELYRGTGRVRWRAGELFTDTSWFYIFEGLGVYPAHYDPLLDVVTLDKLEEILAALADGTAALRRAAPLHDSYFAPRSVSSSALKATQ